jgi:hypothetical protein
MNPSLRKILVASLTAAIPLTLAAESSTSSSTRPMPDTSRDTTHSSASLSMPSSSSSSTAAGSIQRVTDKSLDHQFTAKDLIGKELYDRQGKRIGEVKDIVLASSSNPELATNLSSKAAMRAGSASADTTSTGTTRSTTSSVGGPSATTTSSTGGSVAASRTAGSADVSGVAADLSRRADAMLSSASEDAVIVSYGGFLGAGNSLLRVPFSQLNYDASSRHITINMAESELSSLPESKDMSRSAAE